MRARCSIKGCFRGFTGQTLHRAVKLLVSTGVPQEKAIKCITEAAETRKRLWIKEDWSAENNLQMVTGLINPGQVA